MDGVDGRLFLGSSNGRRVPLTEARVWSRRRLAMPICVQVSARQPVAVKCGVLMGSNRPCDKPAVDRKERCILHLDEKKDITAFEAALRKVITEYASNDQIYDFTAFIFPAESAYLPVRLQSPVLFTDAKFLGRADFSRIEFAKVSFVRCVFEKEADFSTAVFNGFADFSGARFFGDAEFTEAVFAGTATFQEATFGSKDSLANFIGTVFAEDANFGNALFAGDVYFNGAVLGSPGSRVRFDGTKFTTPTRAISFAKCRFVGDTGLLSAIFTGDCDFSGCGFQGKTDFEHVEFAGVVILRDCTVNEKLIFKESNFAQASFRGSEIHGRLRFEDTGFGRQGESNGDARTESLGPAIDFQSVDIADDGIVEFVGHRSTLNLSSASFLHTDVRKVLFERVEWERSPQYTSWSLRLKHELHGESKRIRLFDEKNLTAKAGGAYHSTLQISPQHVAELYRRLRRNYEDNLRYPEAGDFYIGEMEMERLNRKLSSQPRRIVLWHADLHEVYRLLSLYGESYSRAAIWIVSTIGFFAVIRYVFPAADGVQGANSVTDSFTHSIEAFFQLRSVTFVDSVERIWSVILIALFALAIRRRFKR